jgi:hypothetical protein
LVTIGVEILVIFVAELIATDEFGVVAVASDGVGVHLCLVSSGVGQKETITLD